jgi:hypothetical protein
VWCRPPLWHSIEAEVEAEMGQPERRSRRGMRDIPARHGHEEDGQHKHAEQKTALQLHPADTKVDLGDVNVGCDDQHPHGRQRHRHGFASCVPSLVGLAG